jgi:N-acetylmuramoyl-L-alanine amidase
MKKSALLLIIFSLGAILSVAQNGNFIKVIVPERDSIVIAAKYQRLNACTKPGSNVTINGENYKVYPTGAFAGYIALLPGLNRLVIESVHPTQGKVTKTMVIESKIPEPEKIVSNFSIEYARTIPAVDQSLQTGDIIQVRMKALPGCQAYFLGNKPMFELPETQTNGIKGIYQGIYRLHSGDTLTRGKIDFTLTQDNNDAMVERGFKPLSTTTTNIVSMNSGDFPAVGQTRGTFPYFNYGLGEDRLGGARIGYLDTLVNLQLTGRTGDFYHVKLSESQSVYIPADQVKLLPKGTFPPWSLMDSWTVSGDDRYDYLRIGLSQRLPYISKYEINPSRIVLDIFGAVSNTNWITQLTSAREIKNVWYEQPEKNVVRVTLELKHAQAWGYSVFYERNRLTVRIKQQPKKLLLSNLTIGLDAGHGGSNEGALGSTGALEKEINLSVVMKMKAALEKLGAKTVLTRSGNETLSTTARWLIWQKAEPDIVLSFHCNSIGNSDPLRTKGTSTYYKYIAFRPLSETLYDELLKTGLSEFGNIGSFNFLLNAPTEFPNALIEMAFMSHPEDEMKLLNPAFQDKIVSAVLKGLERFLKQGK